MTEEIVVNRGRGRPKGSKNKNAAVIPLAEVEDMPQRGRGRPKGSTIKKVMADNATAIQKKQRVIQHYEAKIPKRRTVSQLSGDTINNFTGKDYEDALNNAYAWAERTGNILVDYFEQEAFGCSILVGYKKKKTS